MDKNAFLSDLLELTQNIERFLKKWKDPILAFLVNGDPSANEAFWQECLSDILEHLHQTLHLTQYLQKDVKRIGILSTDREGNVLLCGKRLPPLEEFEIYQYDNILQKTVWTRTFVNMRLQGQAPSLAGLEKGKMIDGIKARARW